MKNDVTKLRETLAGAENGGGPALVNQATLLHILDDRARMAAELKILRAKVK